MSKVKKMISDKKFEVYHSPELYSFTLIEVAKKDKQKHLLEEDAILIDEFSFTPVEGVNEDVEFDQIKRVYNKCIEKFMENAEKA